MTKISSFNHYSF